MAMCGILFGVTRRILIQIAVKHMAIQSDGHATRPPGRCWPELERERHAVAAQEGTKPASADMNEPATDRQAIRRVLEGLGYSHTPRSE
jgi:hypothetical protein